jgi:nitrite reductase/ring-hydroxylating ferredoxin subunit
VSSSLNGDGDDVPVHGSPVLLRLEALADGALAAADATVDGASESLIVYRDGRHVRAWLNICPHAGRRLDWSPGQFLKSRDGLLVCAVHGASFELTGGRCVAGPCLGDRLHEVAVDVRDGWVLLADGDAREA